MLPGRPQSKPVICRCLLSSHRPAGISAGALHGEFWQRTSLHLLADHRYSNKLRRVILPASEIACHARPADPVCGDPGPCWVRTSSETTGPGRARAVRTGMQEPQVAAPARPRVRPLCHGGSGFESHPTAAAGRLPLPTSQASQGRVSPIVRVGAITARPNRGRAHQLCPYRAIQNGHERSQAGTHGQRYGALNLHSYLPSQVTSLPDVALGAGVTGCRR
jgi:hypothetical protein